jgi:hypothetical protein
MTTADVKVMLWCITTRISNIVCEINMYRLDIDEINEVPVGKTIMVTNSKFNVPIMYLERIEKHQWNILRELQETDYNIRQNDKL